MDLACARLEAVGKVGGLIASTDADSTVATDWIARQLDALAAGAEAVGGDVILDPDGKRELPSGVIEVRDQRLRERLVNAALRGPAEHAHFAGASIGITPRAYRKVGGIRWLAALEDKDLEDRLAASGIPIHRLKPIRVTTSTRTDGRAEQGLAADLAEADVEQRKTADPSRWS